MNEERKLRALKTASAIIDLTKEYCKAMRSDLSFIEKLLLTDNYELRKHLIISQRFDAGGITSDDELLTVNIGDSSMSADKIKDLFDFASRSNRWAKIYEGYELVV